LPGCAALKGCGKPLLDHSAVTANIESASRVQANRGARKPNPNLLGIRLRPKLEVVFQLSGSAEENKIDARI
jgi:hypothetical protein